MLMAFYGDGFHINEISTLSASDFVEKWTPPRDSEPESEKLIQILQSLNERNGNSSNTHSFWTDQSRQKLKLHEHLQFFQGVFGYSPGKVSLTLIVNQPLTKLLLLLLVYIYMKSDVRAS